VKDNSSTGPPSVRNPDIPRVAGVNSVATKRGSLGRGRMGFQDAMETNSGAGSGGNDRWMKQDEEEDKEVARKRERKLRKMLRQVRWWP